MSFGDHLDELRRRLIAGVAGFAVIFVVGLVFGGRLMEVITAPVLAELQAAGQAANLLATSPLESFASYMKVAAVTALVIGMPWLLYQAWLFVAPGLYKNEQRFVYVLMPLSVLLTIAGIAFLYYLVLPLSLYFLISFGAGLIDSQAATSPLVEGLTLPTVPVLSADATGVPAGSMWVNSTLGHLRIQVTDEKVMGLPLISGGTIAQQYRISEYVDLVFMLGLAFAVCFQVPLVLMLLSWAGLLRAGDVVKYRKQVMFGCVIAAALLPTQDPGSLLLLSGALILLFEFGLVLMRTTALRRAAGLDAPRTDAEAEA